METLPQTQEALKKLAKTPTSSTTIFAKRETEKKVKEQLYSFFRGNKKLIHIDLTSTNLSEVAILHIIPAIKRSKSLQGVHLSGNPGVTVAVKKEAR